MTYSEKLRSPKWQKRRNDILIRDGYKCQLCGDTETNLQVHHKYYKKGYEVWDYTDEELLTLCETCHVMEEGNKMIFLNATNELLRSGFTYSEIIQHFKNAIPFKFCKI